MQEQSRGNRNSGRNRTGGRTGRTGRSQHKKKANRKTGYIRLTFLAASAICVILVIYAIKASHRPAEGNGGLVITVSPDDETEQVKQDTGSEEAYTENQSEPVETKEINSDDYRPIIKTRADLMLGELVMVNSSNSWKFPNVSTFMQNISSQIDGKHYKLSYNTHTLQKVAVEALNTMTDDFYDVFMSNDMTIVTSTVSYSDQNQQYAPVSSDSGVIQNDTQLAPGYSEHHTGYAFDLKLVSDSGTISAYDGTGNYKWINDNCYKYGFVVRYPVNKEEVTGRAADAAHFRYVGIPHSYIMRKNEFTLEEYMNDLKKYIFGYEHLFFELYGYEYEIYFVPIEDGAEETVVPVPKEDAYTVSGNNSDGFIVTICRETDEINNHTEVTAAASDNEEGSSDEN